MALADRSPPTRTLTQDEEGRVGGGLTVSQLVDHMQMKQLAVKSACSSHSHILFNLQPSCQCCPTPSPMPTREYHLDSLAYFFLSASHGVSTSPLCKEQAPQVFHVIILLFAISCCSFNFSSVRVKNCPFIVLKGKRGR